MWEVVFLFCLFKKKVKIAENILSVIKVVRTKKIKIFDQNSCHTFIVFYTI